MVSGGLTPIAIDLDMFAGNARELRAPTPTATTTRTRATALVDVGAKTTSINVMRGGVSCFSREIPIGGANMTQAVSRRLGVEGFEAEAIKAPRGPPGGGAHRDRARARGPQRVPLSMDYVEHNEGVTVTEILLSAASPARSRPSNSRAPARPRGTPRGPARGRRSPRGGAEPGLSLVVAVGLASACATNDHDQLPARRVPSRLSPIGVTPRSPPRPSPTPRCSPITATPSSAPARTSRPRAAAQLDLDGPAQVVYQSPEGRDAPAREKTFSEIIATASCDQDPDEPRRRSRGPRGDEHFVWFEDIDGSRVGWRAPALREAQGAGLRVRRTDRRANFEDEDREISDLWRIFGKPQAPRRGSTTPTRTSSRPSTGPSPDDRRPEPRRARGQPAPEEGQ